MIACQLLYFRQHGHFVDDRSELDPDVVDYVADQIGAADDLTYSFSTDTARRQSAVGFAFWQHRIELASRRPIEPNEPLPRFVAGQWASPSEDIGGPPMYAIFKEAHDDAGHPEHEWAKEAGNVDWAPDEIHHDVVADQFARRQKQKRRQPNPRLMEG